MAAGLSTAITYRDKPSGVATSALAHITLPDIRRLLLNRPYASPHADRPPMGLEHALSRRKSGGQDQWHCGRDRLQRRSCPFLAMVTGRTAGDQDGMPGGSN